MNENWKALFNVKGKYGVWGIAAFIVLGILLMVVPGFLLEPKGNPPGGQARQHPGEREQLADDSLLQLEEQYARQAEKILNQGAHFGKVSVAVTLEAGPEQDFARNIQNRQSVVEESDPGGAQRITSESQEEVEYVFAQGRGDPLVLREKSAQIKGVLVIAEGAADSAIKHQLSEAVQSLFDLPAHRVMILPMKGR
ncbi:MAG TPA: hypothetical protein PLJ33_01965 [Peptococcaceae bacterium]|jgi:stage III sporulation protein AG|nr:hypothetical protein [Clostridia bacterium]HOB81518.1 hypothetical protein [Peptococcaceae bacterium]HPZ71758.1 hypothetical protein [Peptococcaceae bacterium]HQD53606.1 hypothetical protein [Peptococcaceae bacterium]